MSSKNDDQNLNTGIQTILVGNIGFHEVIFNELLDKIIKEGKYPIIVVESILLKNWNLFLID